mmetsp:Transcript_1303/g.3481  ORF Transcript_1303/g.3481 Transcript_1303/m.3481 type:complete len:100 (-) Transcript_1303:10-309(-)
MMARLCFCLLLATFYVFFYVFLKFDFQMLHHTIYVSSHSTPGCRAPRPRYYRRCIMGQKNRAARDISPMKKNIVCEYFNDMTSMKNMLFHVRILPPPNL